MNEYVVAIPSPGTPYAAHQAVWNLTGKIGGAPRDFLFRVRYSTRPGLALVKVRSTSLPFPGVPVTPPIQGGLYRFSVLINPVRRGKNVEFPIRRKEDVLAWLNERLERGGMAIKTCVLDFLPSVKMGKPKHPATIHTVEATGTVEVLDATKAFQVLGHGIGRVKSMGYGMLELEACHE